MTMAAELAGEALRVAAGELVRAWRSARLSRSAALFPGALDGVLQPFLEALGEALAEGRAPEEAWASTAGVVRLLSGARGWEVLASEWETVAGVLAAACDSLQAEPAARERVTRTVGAAARGVAELGAAAGPAAVLVVHLLGGFRPRAETRGAGRR